MYQTIDDLNYSFVVYKIKREKDQFKTKTLFSLVRKDFDIIVGF